LRSRGRVGGLDERPTFEQPNVTTEPNKKRDADRGESLESPFDEDDPDVDERPTVAPPFDVENYARTTAEGEGEVEVDADERPTVAPPFDVENYAKTAAAGAEVDEPEDSERPTLAPPFDMAVYAQETMAGSSALPAGPPASQAPVSATSPDGEMRQRFAHGDFGGALAVAEKMLEEDPGCIEARECAQTCRTLLEGTYAAQIGPLRCIPSVAMARAQLQTLTLDHRAGFMLSLVDGVSSFSLILDISGMARLEGLRILSDLVQRRVLSVRDG
jgi:hypothetical protein